ncbi:MULTISPECIES: SGNH family hydrolase [unclassified Bartonella]|uniref:SGNH/GDSL hydrolase family protein n=1 Tax=unclassified Bartonella TaxID=2645622 RepID=UPI00236051C7|nr:MULTISPECIES: SGNH family hydrolase [unclassified Bartonella]
MSCFRSLYLIFLCFSLFAVSVIQPSPSKATNFFKWLYQHNTAEQQPPQVIEQKIYKPQKKSVVRKPQQQLKGENAKRILVIGDFVASAVADALKKLFTENSDVIIINDTVPASGLVRTDHISWKNNISERIDKNKPDAIVMVIGANDNQPITTSYGIFNTVQTEWLNIYKQKISEIVESLHSSGKPWIWMGQPAFGNDTLTQKMKIFNALYKQKTEQAGGYFIDIWSGFTDEQGQFSFSSYDTDGKVVRLRTPNGINFTTAGKRKLASYLEKQLENILSFHTSSHESLILNNTNVPKLIQQLDNIVRQPPMSLDNIAQQNTHLVGKIEPSFIQKSWSPPNGHQRDRADNFSFP